MFPVLSIHYGSFLTKYPKSQKFNCQTSLHGRWLYSRAHLKIYDKLCCTHHHIEGSGQKIATVIFKLKHFEDQGKCHLSAMPLKKCVKLLQGLISIRPKSIVFYLSSCLSKLCNPQLHRRASFKLRLIGMCAVYSM